MEASLTWVQYDPLLKHYLSNTIMIYMFHTYPILLPCANICKGSNIIYIISIYASTLCLLNSIEEIWEWLDKFNIDIDSTPEFDITCKSILEAFLNITSIILIKYDEKRYYNYIAKMNKLELCINIDICVLDYNIGGKKIKTMPRISHIM